MKREILVQEFDKARLPWEDRPYPVVPHCDWSVKSKDIHLRKHTLKHHPSYWSAKRYGDYTAAQMIIDDLISENSLLRIQEIAGDTKPLIVPARARNRKIGPLEYDLKIAPEVVQSLKKKHGNELNGFWNRQCGYGIEGLTRQEGEFINFFETVGEIRSGFLAEKHDGHTHGGPEIS